MTESKNDSVGSKIAPPVLMAPAVPFMLASPILNGVKPFPPWTITISPPSIAPAELIESALLPKKMKFVTLTAPLGACSLMSPPEA